MKIVVTGALGHIGSKLIRELPRSFPGVEILMIDNMYCQRYPSLFDLPSEGNYKFVEADILTADLNTLFKGAEAVVHLAAITNAEGSFDKRDLLEQVNFGGTERVAHACIETGAAMIHFSSTSVYGSQSELVDEMCAIDELKPQSPYAESKLREERIMQDLGRNNGLKFFVGRFGTIFGTSPGMRFHTAVNKFCWQAIMNQPITVWRTAYNQKRPYLDLVDAVRAIEFVISNRIYHQKIYNVLTTNLTVSDIVGQIQKSVPNLKVDFVDSPIMNQLSYEVSDAQFRSLGFRTRGDVQKGIGETISLLKGSQEAERFVTLAAAKIKMAPDAKILLNLGCGGRPLSGYVNVDQDSIESLRHRYPNQTFDDDIEVYDYSIFDLPYEDSTVTEVRCDSLIEHLSFKDEPRFFYEVKRVLKPGGMFRFSTPDFEKALELWLAAKDEWKDFYRDDPDAIKSQHWFGQGSYTLEQRWGYLLATIFGSQNGSGQHHLNAYSQQKIRAVMEHLGFDIVKMSQSRWKGDRDYMIDVEARKR